MEPYAAEWWSIVPPIVAIGLALLTKEVFSSLLVGIFTGTLIYAVGTDANIVMGTLETAFTMMAKKVDFNILIFCSLLGALVALGRIRAWSEQSLFTTTSIASPSVLSCV